MTVIAAAADGRGSKGNVVARHSGSSITKQCAATRIHCTDNDIIPSLTGVSHFVPGIARDPCEGFCTLVSLVTCVTAATLKLMCETWHEELRANQQPRARKEVFKGESY